MVKMYIVAFPVLLAGAAQSVQPLVHHPEPTEPKYIAPTEYVALKSSLTPPPGEGTKEQKKDEEELLNLQNTRTSSDCDAARGEVLVSLASFFGTPASPIAKADIDRLSPFFEQVRNDADFFIQKLKKDFPRKRPFVYLKGLQPCVPKEVTDAYPSGHAVLSKLFALILTDIYSDHRIFFEKRAKEIAEHRVLAGMHHRTDVEAGRQLADLIYRKLKESKTYASDLNRHRKK